MDSRDLVQLQAININSATHAQCAEVLHFSAIIALVHLHAYDDSMGCYINIRKHVQLS